MDRTIPTVVRENARRSPDSTATISQGRTSTWGELDVASNRVANGLRNLGLEQGARVAFLGKNSDRWFEILFGTGKAGAVLVSVNWRLAAPELQFLLEDSESQILFVDGEFAPTVESIRAQLPLLLQIVVIDSELDDDGYVQWAAGLDTTDPELDSSPGDDAIQLYTSGTTGRPKGALVPHTYLFENFRLMATIKSEYWKWDSTESAVVTAPLFHIGGINWAFIGAIQGCPLVIMREFDPVVLLSLVSEYPVPALPLVTPMLQIFLNTPGVEEADFSSVRYVVYGASPIPPGLLRKALDVMGCGFVQMYGATESTIVTVLDADEHQLPPVPRMLSVGRPMDGVELVVLDPDGNELPTGEIGELAIKSPVLTTGYWHMPEATSEAFRGGWFHTGDAGYVDEAGYVFLKDRVKDTIISGGENVYPAEVENVLYDHPSVKEVAVVGVPDERWGEVPKAFIVLAPGSEIDEEELRAFAAEHLAKFKVPRHFSAVAALPRNASGKVLRRELRVPADV